MLCRCVGFAVLSAALAIATPAFARRHGGSESPAYIGWSLGASHGGISKGVRPRRSAPRHYGVAYITQVRPRALYVHNRRSWERFVDGVLYESEQKKAAAAAANAELGIPSVPGAPGVSILWPDQTHWRNNALDSAFAASAHWSGSSVSSEASQRARGSTLGLGVGRDQASGVTIRRY
jgi:hypothetical protein